MTDRDALLRAICENPDDDVLRLAYADFLEEDGDPARADFVRTQVEYAQTPPGSPVYPFVLWRNLQFERQYTTALRAELPRWPGVDFGHHVRGFVEDLHVNDYRTLKAHAREVFGTFPIRSLRVRHLSEPALLADLPELRYVRRLNLLFCGLQVETLRTLLGSPYLTNLASLELDSNALPADVVGVIEGAVGNLPALRELWLGGNRVTDAGADRIARSAHFGPLRVLDLSHNLLTESGVRALVGSPRLTNLTRLILKGLGPFPSNLVRLQDVRRTSDPKRRG